MACSYRNIFVRPWVRKDETFMSYISNRFSLRNEVNVIRLSCGPRVIIFIPMSTNVLKQYSLDANYKDAQGQLTVIGIWSAGAM